MNFPHGSVAKCLRCGGIFSDYFAVNELQSVALKGFFIISQCLTKLRRMLLFWIMLLSVIRFVYGVQQCYVALIGRRKVW